MPRSHALDDKACRLDGVDQSCRFAEPHAGVLRIAVHESLAVGGPPLQAALVNIRDFKM